MEKQTTHPRQGAAGERDRPCSTVGTPLTTAGIRARRGRARVPPLLHHPQHIRQQGRAWLASPASPRERAAPSTLVSEKRVKRAARAKASQTSEAGTRIVRFRLEHPLPDVYVKRIYFLAVALPLAYTMQDKPHPELLHETKEGHYILRERQRTAGCSAAKVPQRRHLPRKLPKAKKCYMKNGKGTKCSIFRLFIFFLEVPI